MQRAPPLCARRRRCVRTAPHGAARRASRRRRPQVRRTCAYNRPNWRRHALAAAALPICPRAWSVAPSPRACGRGFSVEKRTTDPDDAADTRACADYSHHEFALSDLPVDLASVLADYDVNGDGTITVAELAAGAELLRRQTKKAWLCFLVVSFSCRLDYYGAIDTTDMGSMPPGDSPYLPNPMVSPPPPSPPPSPPPPSPPFPPRTLTTTTASPPPPPRPRLPRPPNLPPPIIFGRRLHANDESEAAPASPSDGAPQRRRLLASTATKVSYQNPATTTS